MSLPNPESTNEMTSQNQITKEQPEDLSHTEFHGVSSEIWERWRSQLLPDDLSIPSDYKIIDDKNEFELLLLSPLGRGVSASVYVIQIINSVQNPEINSQLYSLKVFRKNQVSLNQGNIESTVIPSLKKLMASRRNSPFINFLTSLTISDHFAIITELCGPTLFQVLTMRRCHGLPLPVIRSILTQLLQGLEKMEGRAMVHGDIKPENVLLSLRHYGPITSFESYKEHLQEINYAFTHDEFELPGLLEIVLIDWSSTSIGFNQIASYMQSRFYRAPEILLREKFGPAADIWSVGCFASELFLGSPLFPGSDENDMLVQIQLKFGPFPLSLTRSIGIGSVAKGTDHWKLPKELYVPGNFENYIQERSGRSDFEVLAFINILRLMLQVNPDARITASSAVMHPFITGTIESASLRVKGRRESDESDGSSGGRRKHSFKILKAKL